MRDVHWFEVTEKLRDSHPAYTGPFDGEESAERVTERFSKQFD